MNKVIPNLPNEIVDKIFKEFCGYAGYRISKTGKVFVWKKIKMDDFRYPLFKIRQKAVRFEENRDWFRHDIFFKLSWEPQHWMRMVYTYIFTGNDFDISFINYVFTKSVVGLTYSQAGQRIEHSGNYEVRCPLSDIYKKNDNYNKAFEKSTKRMPKLLGKKPKKVDGYSLTKPYNPGNRIKL